MLLHRPELYLAHDEGREAVTGIVELAAVGGVALGSLRSRLRYDTAKKIFRSGGRGRLDRG